MRGRGRAGGPPPDRPAKMSVGRISSITGAYVPAHKDLRRKDVPQSLKSANRPPKGRQTPSTPKSKFLDDPE